jgi:hypothetical protein
MGSNCRHQPDDPSSQQESQVALGFLLTAGVIRLMAAIASHYGWNWALASMALGPLLGIWAMSRLLPRMAPSSRVYRNQPAEKKTTFLQKQG